MKTYVEKNGYAVARMQRRGEDYFHFHRARTQCMREKEVWDFPDVRTFNEKVRTPQESGYYWQHTFARGNIYFVLFHNPEGATEPEYAGTIDVAEQDFDGKMCALLESLHVTKPHRGHHASDMLFEAALNYAAHETKHDRALAYIIPTNGSSRACAERNGFKTDGSMIYMPSLNVEALIYTRPLDDLRAAKPAPAATQTLALDTPT